jgi:hypothetical protein
MASLVFVVVMAGVAGAQAAEDVLASGTFAGASGHKTSGGVAVVRTDAGAMVVLQEDFSLDGAPDPKVGFGRDGAYDKSSQLAPLGANKGHQTYQLPASVDPAKYNEVYIWCERFSVPLGVAKLQ